MPISVRVSDSCSSCGDLLADRQLSMIESGYMTPMLKDPRFLRFVAWSTIPAEERPDDAVNIRLFIHQECLTSSQGELEEELVEADNRDSRHCDLCRRLFDKNHRVFQITEWSPEPDASLENGQPEFVPDATVDKVLLCPGCMKNILGEGDETEGDAYLSEGVLTR